MTIYWLLDASSRTIVVQVGGWPAPFGVTVALDALSALLILVSNVVALACLIHAFGSLTPSHERGWFHPLFHFLVMGVNFAFITGDLFNLFVAFEIVLLSSYALLCIGASREQLSQAYKYVMINLIGSTFFVLGAGLVYGMMGTLNFADLAAMVAASTQGGPALPAGFHVVGMLLLFVFALKAAIFPLWFWLPDSYPTCPIAISALFFGLLTKVGVYALLRIFPLIFFAPNIREMTDIEPVLAAAAGLSLIVAILAAVAMRSVRRVLALTLMSHIGYFAFGIAMSTPDALAGSIYYMLQHMIVMAALLLCCGLIEAYHGDDDALRSGGLAKRAPWLAVFFFIGMMTLVGVPPTSGFFGKLLLIKEGFALADRGYWILSLLGLLTGLLTLIAIGKVWARVFWMPVAPDVESREEPRAMRLAPAYAGAALLTVVLIAISLAAEPMTRLCRAAATNLVQPKAYVVAVLGPQAWPGGVPAPDPRAAASDDAHGPNPNTRLVEAPLPEEASQ
jgi:multicomponent Na+:H+ antiporter subunit D